MPPLVTVHSAQRKFIVRLCLQNLEEMVAMPVCALVTLDASRKRENGYIRKNK